MQPDQAWSRGRGHTVSSIDSMVDSLSSNDPAPAGQLDRYTVELSFDFGVPRPVGLRRMPASGLHHHQLPPIERLTGSGTSVSGTSHRIRTSVSPPAVFTETSYNTAYVRAHTCVWKVTSEMIAKTSSGVALYDVVKRRSMPQIMAPRRQRTAGKATVKIAAARSGRVAPRER
jgi:hypothetical protein